MFPMIQRKNIEQKNEIDITKTESFLSLKRTRSATLGYREEVSKN